MDNEQKLKKDLHRVTNHELRIALIMHFEKFEGMEDAFRFINDKSEDELEEVITEVSKKPKRYEYFDLMMKVRERINATDFDSVKDLKSLEKYLDCLPISTSPSENYFLAFYNFYED